MFKRKPPKSVLAQLIGRVYMPLFLSGAILKRKLDAKDTVKTGANNTKGDVAKVEFYYEEVLGDDFDSFYASLYRRGLCNS